ncbi:hypothetical protein DDB_G0281397 [Dictyostelium discoideum AX4]|uniref:Uncharacterized protein n=1 Tax=Dictyostelium discoideum TaxID=44689 RepID=Q54U10_DICDI|nr:hypothetical protein DDB_G0281397 [Dictyostelium discoideum AX4]EAL66680.1 hypothetical protein DDB_G0281397 [Dictyostelium discoideum AX4]|eukprot:XP_640651.1 hypothetical protein DDB_G0281397 [Dictyostelium discoideum AX4]
MYMKSMMNIKIGNRTGSIDSPFNSFLHRGDKAMWSYFIVAQYNNTENDPGK